MKAPPHEELLARILAAAPPPAGVDKALDGLAAVKPGLEWRFSIVDLLRLFDLDSTHATRRRLAKDLGCPPDQIDSRGSAELNLWVLKQIFSLVRERGGCLEADLPV